MIRAFALLLTIFTIYLSSLLFFPHDSALHLPGFLGYTACKYFPQTTEAACGFPFLLLSGPLFLKCKQKSGSPCHCKYPREHTSGSCICRNCHVTSVCKDSFCICFQCSRSIFRRGRITSGRRLRHSVRCPIGKIFQDNALAVLHV